MAIKKSKKETEMEAYTKRTRIYDGISALMHKIRWYDKKHENSMKIQKDLCDLIKEAYNYGHLHGLEDLEELKLIEKNIREFE